MMAPSTVFRAMALRSLVLLSGWALFAAALRSVAVEQIHLAFGPQGADGYPSGMVVSWATPVPTPSVVYYGLFPYSLNHRVEDHSLRYYDVPGGSYHHHVTLTGLLPNTRYYYVCGDEEGGLSSLRHFHTAKTALQHDDAHPFKVAIFGDMGVHNSDHTMATLTDMHAHRHYDFIWHIGDIAYCDDAELVWPFAQFKYEDWYNEYQQRAEPFASRTPVMVLPGNHEAECHSPYCQTHQSVLAALGNFSAYNARFHMPSQSSNGADSMWYSFNFGSAHFVSVNTETDYPDAPNDKFSIGGVGNGGFGDQLRWLEEDLRRANEERHVRPWILVSGHRPMYTAQMATSDGQVTGYCRPMQKAFEDLLYKYQVDMYFAGHVHSYERQWPVYGGVPFRSYDDPPFPTHIIAGAAGNIEGLSNYTGCPVPPWNVVRNNETYGMGILELHNHSTATWTYYDSKTREVLDTITLTRSAGRDKRP